MLLSGCGWDVYRISECGSLSNTPASRLESLEGFRKIRCPETGLAPAERGPYYRWLFFAAGPVEAAVSNRALGVEVPEAKESSVGYGNFAAVMDCLLTAVSTDGFIAGDSFSAADICVGSQIGFGLSFGTIEACPPSY